MTAKGMKPELTARQEDALCAIQDYVESHGYPPTLAELGARLGIQNPNGVRGHVLALERKGYLERRGGISRGITVRGWTRVLDATLGRLRGRHRGAFGRSLGGVTYHLAWPTKKGKPFLDAADVAAAVEQCIRQVAAEHGWTVLMLDVRPSEVRLSVTVDPEHSPVVVVDHMKWYVALLRLGRLRKLGVKLLWGAGCAAAGTAEDLDPLAVELLRRESGAEKEGPS